MLLLTLAQYGETEVQVLHVASTVTTGMGGLLTLSEVKALHPIWLSLTPFQHECWAPRYSLKRMKIYIPYSAFAGVSRDCGASFFPSVFACSKALI